MEENECRDPIMKYGENDSYKPPELKKL